MLRRIRTSPWIRTALCAAALLSLSTSFGLHPEPVGSDAVAAHRGLSSAHVDDGPHTCLACLTHVTAFLQPAHAVLRVGDPSSPGARLAGIAFPGRVFGRDRSGRSPPARS